MPLVAGVLLWAGRRSLSLLVAQDFLRLVVGTLVALGAGLRDLTWWMLPVYTAAALMLTQYGSWRQRFAAVLWPVVPSVAPEARARPSDVPSRRW